MSSYAFNYSFNITGNCSAAVSEIAENVDALNRKIKDSTGFFDTFQSTVFKINQCSDYINNLANSMDELMRPGANLNAQIADLAAISGATGKELAIIEENARATAKAFGGSAAQSVESYKLLLSQLSPELTKQPAALRAMGDNIAILSKTMGGDATAAATVLTTAMNQYGVSLDDPMEASRKMAEMMNIMAAAGREGSAELPTIQQALEQCGMMAKASGVSFAETNAAIQALDKAGKKGAEGGVALRNVMSILSQGRFLPKDVREELSAAGININDLTDKSKSLTERMRALQPVMNDSALFTKLFGRENSAAAMALMQSLDQVDTWTTAITGTTTAVDQSQIIMETYNERLSRIQARFDDIKISIFNATGDFGIWTQVVAQALIPIAQLTPLIMGVGKAMIWVRSIDFNSVFTSMKGAIAVAKKSLVTLYASIQLSGGFFSFMKMSAVSACRAIGTAIMNIPIVGWIAAAIAAIAALFAYFWKTSAKFRGVIKGIGAFFVAVFKGLWDTAKEVLSKVGDALGCIFTLDFKGAKRALQGIGTAFADYGKTAAQAFQNAYNEEVNAASEATKKDEEDALAGLQTTDAAVPDNPNPIATNLSGIGGKAESSDRIKNINISIESLVGNLTIETTNMHESAERVKDMIAEALLGAVNDVNLAM